MGRVFLGLAGVLLAVSSAALAHHGSAISYATDKPWTAKAVIKDFKYLNPHPLVEFTITDEKGNTVDWNGEIATNPSRLARNGWGRRRSEEAMKPGATVTMTLATAKAGGTHALIQKVENEKGEEILVD